MAHEALDGAHTGALGVAQPGGEFALDIEGQAFLGAPRHVVEVAPDCPQEVFGANELTQLGCGQQPLVDQLGDRLHLIGIFADPE